MTYFKPSCPTDKAILVDLNERQLRHFKLNQQEEAVSIYPPSRIMGRVAQSKPIHYQKVSFSGIPSINLIKKNGKVESFIWRHTAKQGWEFARLGFIQSQSLTTNVIAALGKYHRIVYRRLKDGEISNRYKEKKAIIDWFQALMEPLQKLELLGNDPHPMEYIQDRLDDYIKALKNQGSTLEKYFSNTQFTILDPHGMNRLRRQLQASIRLAEEYKNTIQLHPHEATLSTGGQSILTFVKKQMLKHLSDMQNANQNITYSNHAAFALTRGDLNSCIENARMVISKTSALPNDSIYDFHQGRYENDGKDALVFDSAHHRLSPSEEQEALFVISMIEGANSLDFPKFRRPRLMAVPLGKTSPIEIIYATKWHFSRLQMMVQGIVAWACNVTIKLVFGFIELPLTVFVEPLTFGYGEWVFDAIRRVAVYEVKFKNDRAPTLAWQPLFTAAERASVSFGLRARRLAVNAFRNSLVDIVYGMRDVYKRFTVHMLDHIYDDYDDGKRQLTYRELERHVKLESKTIVRDLHQREAKLVKRFHAKLHPSLTAAHIRRSEGARFSEPSFMPATIEAKDLLNVVANSVSGVAHFYLDNIHAKHSFGGLLFTATYLAGGLVILAPERVAFLGKPYQVFSQNFAEALTKSRYGEAMASASTQAQMTASYYDLGLHGKDGWLVEAARRFEKDPFTNIIYAGTAVGLGYVIAYAAHIPFFSDYLKKEAGKFPASSMGAAGAKTGILTVELLKKEEHLFAKQNDLPSAEGVVPGREQMRKRIVSLLLEHHDQLKFLSAKTKHQLMRCIRLHFSDEMQIRSLSKLLYGHDSKSTLRTTLNIILGYPAHCMRIAVAALISSPLCRNTKPLESSLAAAQFKIMKDSTLVIRALATIIKIPHDFFIYHVKAIFDVVLNSMLARSQGLLRNDHSIAEKTYTTAGKINRFLEGVRQRASVPLDAMTKATVAPHPYDTQYKTLHSSVGLFVKPGAPINGDASVLSLAIRQAQAKR